MQFQKIYILLKNVKNYINNLKYLIWINSFYIEKDLRIFLLANQKNYIYKFCKDLNKKLISYYCFDAGIKDDIPALLNKQRRQIRYFQFPFMKNDQLIFENSNEDYIVFDKISEEEHIYNWINKECEMDVSKVIKSRIKYFLTKICPEIISMVPVFADYYKNNSIDFIVTFQLYSLEEHSAVAAARYSENTKTIYIHHGAGAFGTKSLFFNLVRYFDIYFTSTKGEADHENSIKNEFGQTLPKIYTKNYLFGLYKRKYNRGINWKENIFKSKKQTVLFVPIICTPWPQRPIELSQPFPMEYLKWHKALVYYFSTRKECNFIWKGFLLPNQKFEIIQNVIEDEKFNNVVFNSSKLSNWFGKVDKVLCDTPHTAFFESIYSGLPVLALYRPKDQKLWKNAHDVFNSSLQPYSDVEEGLNFVEKFLDDEPKKYIVDFEQPDTSINNLYQEIIS